MKHAHTMGDRFKALIAYDPLAGLHHKKRRDGGRVNLASIIGEQAKAVDTKPTEGQKAAGNYKKGHVKVHGLDISIENPRGSWREGGPPDKRWRSKLNHHYGYIRKTEGGDGDHVDVYLGPHLKSPHVFVVDQHHLDGDKKFDEHKCFIGFGSKAQAREAYHRAFSDGRGKERIGHSETLTIPDFKLWLAHADTTKAIKSRKNYADGGSVSGDDADVNVIPAPPTSPNYEQANKDLQLNPQEQALYQQHLTNLSGPGGVDNPDGSRSTLYQSVQEHNGKYYNVPTVWNGKRETEQYTQPQSGQVFDVPNQTALQNIGKAGWDTFPSYATPDEADERYDKMHDYMEKDTAAYLQGQQRAEGGRVHMADGGSPNPFDAFDVPQASAVPQASSSANPFDAFDSPSMRHDVAPSAPSLPPEAADHGLSERQKLSPLEKAASPITSYPETYNRMMHEALDQASKGVQHILHPESAWDEAKGIGNAAAGAAGYVASPISAAYRSVIGQPIEDVTGIPREYSEFAAQLATPGIGMTGGAPRAPVVAAAKDVPPPSTKELFKAAENNYKNMHGYGVEIHPHVVSNVADGILDELHTQGYRDYLAPKTFRAVEELKNPVGANSTTQDIEGVRRALNKAGADPAERDAARRAIAAIDGSMASMAPGDVAVNPHFADRVAKEAAEARGNYAAAKRSEMLDELGKKAERQANAAGSGTGIDNATRQRIKSVLDNPKKLRGFSAEEKEQMEQIVRGTFTGNAARLLGKFSPSGVVSGALSAGAGFAAHGPLGAVVLPAAGYAAKKLGDASTAAQTAKLSRIVRSRAPVSRNAAPLPSVVAPSQPLLMPPAGIGAANLRPPTAPLGIQGSVPSYADDKQP